MWDVNTPTGAEKIKQIDDHIRELKVDIQTAANEEHDFPGADPANPKMVHKEGSARIQSGPDALKPASLPSNKLYWAYDSGKLYRGTGTGLEVMNLDADTLDGHQPGHGNGLDADLLDGVQGADYLVKSDIVVSTGILAHGDTIPVPDGFTEAQCKWMAWPVSTGQPSWGSRDWGLSGISVTTNGRTVSITQTLVDVGTGEKTNVHAGTAGYIIIGIK